MRLELKNWNPALFIGHIIISRSPISAELLFVFLLRGCVLETWAWRIYEYELMCVHQSQSRSYSLPECSRALNVIIRSLFAALSQSFCEYGELSLSISISQ